MAETPKDSVLLSLAKEGYSGSYGVLLLVAVLMGTNPDELRPESDAERDEWSGHLQGLRSALTCVAIHEAKLEPGDAAAVVQRHIEDAAQVMGRSRGSR
ncbi:hypothetical protein KGQ19_01330 [Catenulispora sp. NL8]|uniref:Uncharacterized protein n=1 Tax=Catenulispora pinistramenti TaxID=2705254 RepID=A0ABS5KGS3_9ACTN|nr:hypothetical protein [Catenulispora pinistramenti]MBS2545502.1 hypothetical protein [Catenulispora pinistramenti]